jgi:inorganic pyrophosphatase
VGSSEREERNIRETKMNLVEYKLHKETEKRLEYGCGEEGMGEAGAPLDLEVVHRPRTNLGE